jgi:hypothetical protein
MEYIGTHYTVIVGDKHKCIPRYFSGQHFHQYSLQEN